MENFKKQSTLISTMLFIWVCTIFYFNPRLIALLIGNEPFIAKLSVILFILTLDLLWLYGIYHITHILFSYFITNKNPIFKKSLVDENQPYVAVFYTTKNDFNSNACKSCLNQDYKNYKLFICDDSDNLNVKNQIKQFVSSNKNTIEYSERIDRKGFKAGNINNALRNLDKKYEYILVTDSDSELPKDFISRLMPYFKSDNSIAFVQAMQKNGTLSNTEFSKNMDPLISIHYNHYVINKNVYGHSMWFGHGAILRRDVIDEIGGIPEIVTEDLAFSSEIRRFGYQGVIATDVWSFEATPEDILRFRIRNRKWVRGTFEYFIKYFPKILISGKISWFEKLDILISGFSLLQALPFLIFVFIASFTMPLYYTAQNIKGPFFLIPPILYDSWYGVVLNTRYNVFWSWDFYLIMIITIFSPLLPVMWDLRKEKIKMFKFLLMTTFINLSLLFDSAKEIISYLLTRKNIFTVTGDINFSKEKPVFLITELILGLSLSFYAFKTYNLWLLSLALAMIITPFWLRTRPNALLMVLSSIPFFMTSVITFLIGITLIQDMLIS
ncbi:MAG: polysaccharide synthase [uncultured bacterium]|nr:MAG: polysaccharide synthase [uncultured bacterium]